MGGYLILLFGMGGVAVIAGSLGLSIYLAVSCIHLDHGGIWLQIAGFPLGYCQAFGLLIITLLLLILSLLRRHRHGALGGSRSA